MNTIKLTNVKKIKPFLTKKKRRPTITRNRKTRKRIQKMIYTAGNLKIGQGTHGIIYVDIDNPYLVTKSYKYDKTFCANLLDEYKIQQMIQKSYTDQFIRIPKCCCYKITNDKCQYKMERIFPLKDKSYYAIVNINLPNVCRKFSHSNYGYEIGYNVLATNYNVNVNKLSYEIGKMFSYLHYELHIDGYDCELLYGRTSEHHDESEFFLIDYDKVQHLVYDLGYITHRKIDENTIDTKYLSSDVKFAWFLYSAMISMSLIPNTTELCNQFIQGYSFYIPKSDEQIQKISKQVIEIILDNVDV
jgi:hypothetical protein